MSEVLDAEEHRNPDNIVPWSSVYTTMAASVIQGVALYGFFAYNRKKEYGRPNFTLFEPRHLTHSHRSPAPFDGKAAHEGRLGLWWKEAWKLDDRTLLQHVGLDTYMYLRFLRLGARISGFGTFLSVILIPIYATGSENTAASQQFNQLTMARLDPNDSGDLHRTWATLVCWWLFIGFILREFLSEWRNFSVHRAAFLGHGDPDINPMYRYAVLLEQVPYHMRNRSSLRVYLDRLFPRQVEDVTCFVESTKLQQLSERRHKALLGFEQATAWKNARPNKPPKKVKGELAIEHYRNEINRLNREVDKERTAVKASLRQHSKGLDGATAELRNSASGDGDRVEVQIPSSPRAGKNGNIAGSSLAEHQPLSTAFVAFRSLRAKQACLQCELTGDPDNLIASPAPDPSAIIWRNIGISRPRQQILELQMSVVWLVGILFWAIPVAFVASLANLNGILGAVGLPKADTAAAWYGLVSGLLPVIAYELLMMLLYKAIVAVGKFYVRFKSMTQVDSYALQWHTLFQFANLWLILIGGSFFNQMDVLIKNHSLGAFLATIAKAVPGATVFFVNQMIVTSVGAFGIELSLIVPYVISLVLNKMKPDELKTQRQLDETHKPKPIEWGEQLPPIVFTFMVIVMYQSIVPLIELFGFVYFGGSYMVWKHQCLHVYAQDFEGGGQTTWMSLFGFLMTILYMAELTFITYMSLHKAHIQSTLGIVPLLATIAMHTYLRHKIIHPLQKLSLEKAADIDVALEDTSPKDVVDSNVYQLPELDVEHEETRPLQYRRKQEDPTV